MGNSDKFANSISEGEAREQQGKGHTAKREQPWPTLHIFYWNYFSNWQSRYLFSSGMIFF